MTTALGIISTKTVTRPKAAIIGAYVPDRFGHFLRVGYHSGGRYDRWQNAVELTGATVYPNGPSTQWGPDNFGPTTTFAIWTEDVIAPAVGVAFGPMRFGFTGTVTLTVDGKPLASVPVAPLDTQLLINVPTASLPPDGFYSATGFPPDWGVLDFPMTSRSTPKQPPQDRLAVVVGSHTWGHRHDGQLSSAWVPPVFAPTEVPLPPRVYPPITPATFGDMRNFCYTMLAPYRPFDVYRPSRLKSGAIVSQNAQNYFFADLSKKLPAWVTLSGKRGRGTITCPTSLVETGRPTGGKVTGTEPWRVFAVDDDGTVRTVAGYEHDNVFPQFTNVPNDGVQQWPSEPPKLVGDWSGIAAALWGFRNLWDIAWDPDSTKIDLNSVLVNGEPTHIGVGPVAFVTDTDNGRVCKIQTNGGGPEGVALFGNNLRSAPAKVTAFIIGLKNPWGLALKGNELFVTSQLGNVIGVYDKNTGALLRSAPYLRPEGIRFDSDGTLYVGSAGDSTVKIVDPITLTVVRKFCDVPGAGLNTNFLNLAVSKGYVATLTWSNGEYGWPALYDPTGKRVTTFGSNSWNGLPQPKGQPIAYGMSYATAVSMDFDRGRITWGTVQEGLHRLSVALPTDSVVAPGVWQGMSEYDALDLQLLYGDAGFGFYGLPFQWGKYGSHVDDYLKSFGHSPIPMPTPMPTTPYIEKLPDTTPTDSPPVMTVPNQLGFFNMPGSGGYSYKPPNWNMSIAVARGPLTVPQHGHGDLLAVHGDASMGGYDDEVTYANVWNSGGYQQPPQIQVYSNDLIVPLGKTAPIESWNLGYIMADGKVHATTETRLRLLNDCCLKIYPILRSRYYAWGWSMGAASAIAWAREQPDLFSVVYAIMPRWRVNEVQDYVQDKPVIAPPGLKVVTPTGDQDFRTRYDGVARSLDPTIPMTPLVGVIGLKDATVVQSAQETIDGVLACVKGKRWIAFGWNQGIHGMQPDIGVLMRTYNQMQFKVGEGVPLFTHSSRDQDITKDLVGWINLGFKWRNVVESVDGMSFEFTNIDGPCEVDVEPLSRVFTSPVSAQHISITAANEWHTVNFTAVVAPPAPRPTIAGFAATPSAAKRGDTVSIAYSVTDTDTVTLNGNAVPLTGPITFTPTADTVYTLVATGPGGQVTQSLTVTVRDLTIDENVANLLREARAHGWAV